MLEKISNANFVRSLLLSLYPHTFPSPSRRSTASIGADIPPHALQPTDSQGRTYHVSTAPGQTTNRILTVGDPARLHRVAKHLDEWPEPFERVSQRGYTTVTGRYKGVPVSLIAIGMGSLYSLDSAATINADGEKLSTGVAMTDFFVREVRAVVQGELAIIRYIYPFSSLLPLPRANPPEKTDLDLDHVDLSTLRSKLDP